MDLSDTDRRRFIAATALTLLALPALWWANTSENSAAPNLAVAGIDAEVDTDTATEPTAPGTDVVAPVFLDGPSSAAGSGRSQVAVPARPPIDGFTASATFRGSVFRGTCIVSGITGGSEVTVVNLANNRSVTCTSVISPGRARGEVVLPTQAFADIADLTDAPIPVEIRR